jgi:hypothetical protein
MNNEENVPPLEGLILLADIDKVREYCNKGIRTCNEKYMNVFQHDGKKMVFLSDAMITNPKTINVVEKAFGTEPHPMILFNSLEHKWGVHHFTMKDPTSVDELLDNVKYHSDIVSLSISPGEVNEAGRQCNSRKSRETCKKNSKKVGNVHDGLECSWNEPSNGMVPCNVTVRYPFKVLDT